MHYTGKHVVRKHVVTAKMLEAPPIGVGTVLRFERDAGSMCN